MVNNSKAKEREFGVWSRGRRARSGGQNRPRNRYRKEMQTEPGAGGKSAAKASMYGKTFVCRRADQ